jgi:hypothetical protein
MISFLLNSDPKVMLEPTAKIKMTGSMVIDFH